MKRTWTVACVVLFFLLGSAPAFAVSYNQIFVFGDSLSDDGNAYVLTGGLNPLSPPYAQRFSNGPVAVEYLAAWMGVGLSPSVLGGNDYAVGGATTGTGSAIGLWGTGIKKQVSAFTTAHPAFDPDHTLFVVWGGPNDFLLSPFPWTVNSAVNNLAASITALAGAGAEHILVPNMMDLGATPLADLLGVQIYLNSLTKSFNKALAKKLNSLDALLAADIIPFDTFSALNAVLANPSAYGFTNVNDACLYTPACTNPDTFLFWDLVHPTTYTHALLANQFASVISNPEPETLILLLMGMAGLLAMRRRFGGHRSAASGDKAL